MSPDGAANAADLIEHQLSATLAGPRERPLVLGICGAQGSGKSTLAGTLAERLQSAGHRVATLSLDDLYMPSEARERLAETQHPLWRTRGVPGTHDVALGLDRLARIDRGETTALPRFDKARDTRCPQAAWPYAPAGLDVLLFEGWCVGAVPEDEAALLTPVNDLERDEDPDGRWRRAANAALAGSYRALFARIDMLVLLAAPNFEVVAAWRGEQEAGLRRRLLESGEDTNGTMDAAAIGRFVQFYERLTRHILREMPDRADLVLRLDHARAVTQVLVGPTMDSPDAASVPARTSRSHDARRLCDARAIGAAREPDGAGRL